MRLPRRPLADTDRAVMRGVKRLHAWLGRPSSSFVSQYYAQRLRKVPPDEAVWDLLWEE